MSNVDKDNQAFELCQNLADKLVADGYIRSSDIAEAFRTVPRHVFVPEAPLEKAYRDNSIPTKYKNNVLVSSSSQPAIMAIMLEQLELSTGHRVLEIGTGTGYNAGLIRYLVGDAGAVTTIDIDDDIVESAREHLDAAGVREVEAVCGDGSTGFAGSGPYDRIIVTAGAWDIFPAWKNQLKPNGRIVLPLEIHNSVQKSVAFDQKDGHMESVSVFDCGFMRLRGPSGRLLYTFFIPHATEPGIFCSVSDSSSVNAEDVFNLLSKPDGIQPIGVHASPNEVFYGDLHLWLSLQNTNMCSLVAENQAFQRGILPCFIVFPGEQNRYGTIGLSNSEELCLFVHSPEEASSPEQTESFPSSELFVQSYGEKTGLTERLIRQVKDWESAVQRSGASLYIKAYPKNADYTPAPDEFVVGKQWNDLFIRWE